MKDICQSCAMPMTEKDDFGTSEKGEKSHDYCKFCMVNGKFTVEMSLDNYIQRQADIAEKKFGISREKAVKMAGKILPTLKRWKP